MLKKLVIPFFAIAAAFAFTHTGCGSSSTTGTAGTSGGKAGTSGGSAGTSGGSAGTSGGSAGTSGGSAGTSGGSAGTTATGGTTGAGGTAAGGTTGAGGTMATDGGSAGRGADGGGAGTMGGGNNDSGADAALPACSTTESGGTAVLSAVDFCKNMIATCTGIAGVPEPYLNEQSCETMYAAGGPMKRHCQSYHLCGNSFGKALADKMNHCPHAAGVSVCTQTN